jgi:hypothetical protein
MDRKSTIPAAWRHRRTRYDPPGLDEAIAAAQGLTDQIQNQIEIAAQLSGVPEDEVRSRVLMMRAQSSWKRPGSAPSRQTEVVVVKRRGLRAT